MEFDVQKIVARIKAQVADEYQKGFGHGVKWASEEATLSDLRNFAEIPHQDAPGTWKEYWETCAGTAVSDRVSDRVDLSEEDHTELLLKGFQEGVTAVWDAIKSNFPEVASADSSPSK